MLIEKKICIRGCFIEITRPAKYPAVHSAAIHIVEVAIYFVNINPHLIIEGIEDAENAISNDKPATRFHIWAPETKIPPEESIFQWLLSILFSFVRLYC